MDDASTLPGLVPVIGGQLRYQLTLLMRTHARTYDVSAPGTAVTEG